MREKISACITAGNEEHNIRRCLESVRWADEIIVVDSFSRDRTPEICREYTEWVFQHRWLGYVNQKNLVKDLASGPWILFVDADEEVSDGLRQAILDEFESGRTAGVAGYTMPRMGRYLGRWIRHGDWYPDSKLRLFRKEGSRCLGEEPHDRIEVDGTVRELTAPLHHYSYEDIAAQIATMDNFSTITAALWLREGRPFRWTDALLRPPWRFLRGYVLKGGFLDGWRGLTIALVSAFSVYLKYVKLWELRLGSSRRGASSVRGTGCLLRTAGCGDQESRDTEPFQADKRVGCTAFRRSPRQNADG